MLSNQAASPSKPISARLQQPLLQPKEISLLPPKETSPFPPKEATNNEETSKGCFDKKEEKETRGRSTSPKGRTDSSPTRIKDSQKQASSPSKKNKDANETDAGPRYARPKKSTRPRSRTPPKRMNNNDSNNRVNSPQRYRSRSPVPRSNTKFSPQLRTKSPQRPESNNNNNNNSNSKKKRIILSPKSQQRSERRNRPSFQGLSVIDGKRRNKEETHNEDAEISQAKAERRRKSLNFMSKSAQSDQIREILENTMDDYVTAFVIEGTAEERLQAVMTKAKDRGMAPENIFSFFNGGNPNTTHITKETFLEALEKLGDTFVVITDEELTKIVAKFDHNNDGKVSIDEFKNYCYEIPTVPWKAERMRLERSGELSKLKAQLSRRFKASDINDDHCCGEEVFHTSKFFWKTNNNVEIKLFYSQDLNVITVQLYSQTLDKELPSIYVCRNKVEYQITNLEEEVTRNLQSSDAIKEGSIEEVKKRMTWEVISKYIVARLKLKAHTEEISEEEVPKLECAHIPSEATCIPFLCKLTGDTFDTLMIQKPINLSPPPPVSSSKGATGDFEQKMESLKKEARRARASRQSAQGLTDLVASALSEVEATI